MTYTPNYSRRRVYWADQETLNAWTAQATNTAGSFDLATDGLLVCAHPARGQTLLFTTTDVWTMTYIGGPLVFSFAQAGKHCGIVSQQAACVLDTAAYWMGVDHRFFRYDGFVQPIPCDVQDYVFGNFNDAVNYKVWSFANPAFNELTWFYPSSLSSTCDRYVTYNYVEDHWSLGQLDRSTGVTYLAGERTPLLATHTGTLYTHETGNARGNIGDAYLESGPVEMGDGDRVVRVQRIVPDDETQGDVTATLYSSFFPDQAETTYGPYTLASPTSVRITARQFRIRLTEAAATAWRVGTLRIGGVLGGRR